MRAATVINTLPSSDGAHVPSSTVLFFPTQSLPINQNHPCMVPFLLPSAHSVSPMCLPDLRDWDGGLRATFETSRWELLVAGHEPPMPLHPYTHLSKRVPVEAVADDSAIADANTYSPTSTASSQIQEDLDKQKQPHALHPDHPRRRGTAQSTLLEFRFEGLMEALYPAKVPAMDRHNALHTMLWRPVGPELRRPVVLSLRGIDTRTGVVSTVELGSVIFTRERTVPAGREGLNRSRCQLGSSYHVFGIHD